jgi:hypothetical protein
MIRCADNSLYTGITIDLDRRFAEHQSQGKKCAKYLKGKSPLGSIPGWTLSINTQINILGKRQKKGRE